MLASSTAFIIYIYIFLVYFLPSVAFTRKLQIVELLFWYSTIGKCINNLFLFLLYTIHCMFRSVIHFFQIIPLQICVIMVSRLLLISCNNQPKREKGKRFLVNLILGSQSKLNIMANLFSLPFPFPPSLLSLHTLTH